MKSYFSDMLGRTGITSTHDMFRWWQKGRLLLNIIFLVITIVHILILSLVFNDGWIFFLFPLILMIGAVVNLLFVVGFFFEIIAKKLFKSNMDFDKLSPSIKTVEIVIATVTLLLISAWHLSTR